MSSNAKSYTGYSTSSVFSDETDIASDIEADLQDLPMGSEEAETDITSFVGSTTNSFASPPFAGSFSSLPSESSAAPPFSEGETLMQLSSHHQRVYLRSASLSGVHTRLLNAQSRENCGSPSCIVWFSTGVSFTGLVSCSFHVHSHIVRWILTQSSVISSFQLALPVLFISSRCRILLRWGRTMASSFFLVSVSFCCSFSF